VTSLKGQLLVANPAMPDPNFHRTVVLLLAHQEDGALGVVLNRPSELDVDSPLPRWERLVADPPVVFVGGPVAPGAAICLARMAGPPPVDASAGPGAGEDASEGGSQVWEPPDPTRAAGLGGWMPLVGELGTLDLEGDPDDLAIDVDAIRVFAGYAGWGPGQLENEIEAGAWFVVRAESGDALSGDPGQLWKRVLRRQGGRLALVAAYPNDPALN
jgi:putative transcriptional regulator